MCLNAGDVNNVFDVFVLGGSTQKLKTLKTVLTLPAFYAFFIPTGKMLIIWAHDPKIIDITSVLSTF